MKVLIAYFSATGNTKKIAEVMQKRFAGLGDKADAMDITPLASRGHKVDLAPYGALVVGAPIHSCRAPRLVREWLATLDGHGKKCSMFFTYGGFGVHPTHYSTKKILEGRGFTVVSSAEFPGAHTFNIGGWKALRDRPDASDFDVAKEYVDLTRNRFLGEDSGVLGEMEKTEHTDEFLDSIEGMRFKVLTKLPTRDGEECSMCMTCEESCPSGAMNAETGEADGDKCIACLACVANCPDNALKVNDMTPIWHKKLEMDKTSEELIGRKQSRIYS